MMKGFRICRIAGVISAAAVVAAVTGCAAQREVIPNLLCGSGDPPPGSKLSGLWLSSPGGLVPCWIHDSSAKSPKNRHGKPVSKH